MNEYRYHRLAPNENDWTKPSAGRLGRSKDYVGDTGFGHEDWNFSRHIWVDGRYHLYLRQPPAVADRCKRFNIALGNRTRIGHVLVGIVENAEYGVSKLGSVLQRRRAEHLFDLKSQNSLGGRYSLCGTVDEFEALLSEDEEVAWLSVEPQDLTILDAPVLIPDEIIGLRNKRYQLNRISAEDFGNLKRMSGQAMTVLPRFDGEFPEGAQVEKLHCERERDHTQVKNAKVEFIRRNGKLSCEACGFEAGSAFDEPKFLNRIIEAHHDVPLGSGAHNGKTKVRDLRMLCPTCHRAIHLIRPWLLVNQFKDKYFPVGNVNT